MLNFLVTRLFSDKAFFRSETLVIGSVEFRIQRNESKIERKALIVSLEKHRESPQLIQISPRISTIIQSTSEQMAIENANIIFEEVTDALDQDENFMSKYFVYKSGYIRNLRNGQVNPIFPTNNKIIESPIFYIRNFYFEENNNIQKIFLSDKNTELFQRYLRSCHWHRKAKLEFSSQIRIMYRWFSMEAGWKSKEYEDISNFILSSIGYPSININYNYHLMFKNNEEEVIYKAQKNRFKDVVEQLRIARNNFVHSGFREWDLPDNQIKIFDGLSMIACSRLLSILQNAVAKEFSNLDEVKEVFPILLEESINLKHAYESARGYIFSEAYH